MCIRDSLSCEEELESDQGVGHHVIEEAGACHVGGPEFRDVLGFDQIDDDTRGVGNNIPEGLQLTHHCRKPGQGPVSLHIRPIAIQKIQILLKQFPPLE